MAHKRDESCLYTLGLVPGTLLPCRFGEYRHYVTSVAAVIPLRRRVWVVKDRLPTLLIARELVAMLRRCGYQLVTLVKTYDILESALKAGTEGTLVSIDTEY